MEITIDTPTLPVLPPLPDGIEIPDNAEELFPEEPVTIILYGKPKRSLWGTPRQEIAALKEIFMRVPGSGLAEFKGPLPAIHSMTAKLRGREVPMICCDHRLPLPSLWRDGGWRFKVTLIG